VLVNGWTQYAEWWGAYRDALVSERIPRCHIRPSRSGRIRQAGISLSQDDHVAALAILIDSLVMMRQSFPGGSASEALSRLRYAIAHGNRLAGLVPMSLRRALASAAAACNANLRSGRIAAGQKLLQDCYCR